MSQRLRQEKAANESRSRSKWRYLGFVLVGMLGLGLVVVVIGLILVLHTTLPPAIHTDPVAAQRLQQELQEAQTAAAHGTPKMVRADETELNSMLKQQLDAAAKQNVANIGAVVRDLKMSLAKDQLRLYFLANLRGREISLELEGRLRTTDGYFDFDPTSGRIGSLPIPKAQIKRAMEKMLATPEGLAAMRVPSNLRDIHVEDGKMVVVFK